MRAQNLRPIIRNRARCLICLLSAPLARPSQSTVRQTHQKHRAESATAENLTGNNPASNNSKSTIQQTHADGKQLSIKSDTMKLLKIFYSVWVHYNRCIKGDRYIQRERGRKREWARERDRARGQIGGYKRGSAFWPISSTIHHFTNHPTDRPPQLTPYSSGTLHRASRRGAHTHTQLSFKIRATVLCLFNDIFEFTDSPIHRLAKRVHT